MESVTDMQARHRRELRDLQGCITNKKKNATKKTRKGINDECAVMERDLREKQAVELQAASRIDDSGDDESVENVAAKLEEFSVANAEKASASEPQAQLSPAVASTPAKKRNRQKERLARRAAEQKEAAELAADEASHMVDHAAIERAAMAPILAQTGRVEHEIRPDGHCLFSAVADQLTLAGRDVRSAMTAEIGQNQDLPPYRIVRHAAAQYMAAHPGDFAPFLLTEDNDSSGGGDLPAHIARIRDTAAWGGQLELAALVHAYGVDIRVLHDGRSELIEATGADDGKDAARPTLWLVYYRHGFGLGEHYNSLRAKPTTEAAATTATA